MPKTIFISDLHLSPSTHELNSLFLRFIEYVTTQEVDALYILGDFFNYWIGNDSMDPWHEKLITAFKAISQKSKIYFLVGNRDFLINNNSAHILGFELLHKDINIVSICNKNVVILHGDTLCTHDKKYQRFRKIVRNPLIKSIYLLLPLKIRQRLAQELKSQSKRNFNNTKNMAIYDVAEEEVGHLFQSSNCDIMIHGHTHQPKIHEYHHQGSLKKRYVLGDWHPKGAYYLEASYSGNHTESNFELKYFT